MGSPTVVMTLRPNRGTDARIGAKTHDEEGRLKFHFHSFVSFNVAQKTIMALWKAKSLTPEQKVQAVEEESEQKLQSEECGSFLGIDDVRFSEVYSLTLSVPVSFFMELFGGGEVDRKAMERACCQSYSCSPWESEKADVYERQTYYRDKRISRYRGEVTSTQQKTLVPDKNGWLVEEVMTLHGVPLGDYFNLHLRYQIEEVASKPNTTYVRVYFGIEWLKSSRHQKRVTKNILICVIANVCPENIDEVFAFVPLIKHPSKHVFHIVTDRLNYAAMRMWFLNNPPGKATIQVQNVEEFTWLNSSYSPVLKQLSSRSMIDYYFRAHHTNSDANLKFRNPKYLSILNHLRFYLPEIFPKLSKVLFLDDDIVVQKDLSGLWSVDLKGNVNGAVETCGESFHRFDRYLNFSNPLISKNFDPRACGWAYGMNVFDLDEWKRQNITEVYHRWQNLNQDRELWKLGTLPPGLITFWKRTYPLERRWHVLGLGYNPSVNQRDIERAAVVHYNGNLKPWLEIGLPKYRGIWSKHVDYQHVYLRECNINP
ncbi:hypothetical protein F2Q69_00055533 [Brassica cretica]|uniref:Hexosyltransferase n=1 Tax=Brassica cretica TaxID=69181 RepID=A0A8S9MTF9_BRACR|nr:hypothetical protein F2Q69_00055533 [Brassica cretica]